MITTKTMNDGNKATIIKNTDGETILQKITEIKEDTAWVTSQYGHVYPVKLSDKVIMTKNPQKNDIAIVKTFKKQDWIVIDIIKNDTETDEYSQLLKKKYNHTITDIELKKLEWLEKYDEELQQQLNEIGDLIGAY